MFEHKQGVVKNVLPSIELYFICSYKEDTDNGTESDDVIEWITPEEQAAKNDKETIEKVFNQRVGRKEGNIYNQLVFS